MSKFAQLRDFYVFCRTSAHLLLPTLTVCGFTANTLYRSYEYKAACPDGITPHVNRRKNREYIDNLLTRVRESSDFMVYHEVVSGKIYDDGEHFNSYFKLFKLYNDMYKDKQEYPGLEGDARQIQIAGHYSKFTRDLLMAHLLARGHFFTYTKHFVCDLLIYIFMPVLLPFFPKWYKPLHMPKVSHC